VNQSREQRTKRWSSRPSRPSSTRGTIRRPKVLVARLYSAQRAHRPGAGPACFDLIKSIPPTAEIRAGDDRGRRIIVIVHGRFSGFGAPVNWIAADILRVEGGLLVGTGTSSKTKRRGSNPRAGTRCSGRRSRSIRESRPPRVSHIPQLRPKTRDVFHAGPSLPQVHPMRLGLWAITRCLRDPELQVRARSPQRNRASSRSGPRSTLPCDPDNPVRCRRDAFSTHRSLATWPLIPAGSASGPHPRHAAPQPGPSRQALARSTWLR